MDKHLGMRPEHINMLRRCKKYTGGCYRDEVRC